MSYVNILFHMTFLKGVCNMVVNNGFKFTNVIFDNCWIDKDDIFFSGDFNYHKIYNTFSEENVLLDFLSIDTNDNDSVLNFIKRYGFILNLMSPDNNNKSVNVGIKISDEQINEDSIDINGNDVTIKLNYQNNATPFYIYHDMAVFKRSHTRIKSIIELITALKTDNKSNILTHTLFLALDQQPFNLDTIHFSKSYELSYDLDQFASELCGLNKSLQAQINDALESPLDPHDDLVFPFLVELLKELKLICEIVCISDEYFVIFNKDIDSIISELSQNTHNTLKILAREVVRSEINLNLSSVTPILTLDNSNGFYGTWNIPDLLSALYLDIYLKQSSNTIYKKCSNPTCGLFFEVNPDNTVKKYCSTRCGQLMAKRKQREREKSNNI